MQLSSTVTLKEFFNLHAAAIQNHFNIIIPYHPWTVGKFTHMLFIQRSHPVTQPIHGGAKGAAPFLVPAAMAPDIASATRAPALNPVSAAPGSIFNNLHLMGRREFDRIFAIVSYLGKVLRGNMMQAIGQRH